MTKVEQVKVVRKKIKFEQGYLDELIKRKEEAEKELENCSYEAIKEKISNYDMRLANVSNQYMYLCGVLATAYELKLISKDEHDKLHKQVFDEAFN